MKLLLILCLIDRAQVPENTLKGAQGRVEAIYRHAGIAIEWKMSDACAPTVSGRQALMLTLVISPNCISGKTCRNVFLMGTAVGNAGAAWRRAYVFADRVRDTMWEFQRRVLIPDSTSILLSMTMAHEVGHLLLPAEYGHAPVGIMAEYFDVQSLQTAMYGELYFSRAQEELIRSAVRPASEAENVDSVPDAGGPV